MRTVIASIGALLLGMVIMSIADHHQPNLAKAYDEPKERVLLLGSTLEQFKSAKGEPSRIHIGAADSLVVFERPSEAFYVVFRNDHSERVLCSRGDFAPLDESDIMSFLDACDTEWRYENEDDSWRSYKSKIGNIGQYNKKLHSVNIETPEGRAHSFDKTNLISIRKSIYQTNDEADIKPTNSNALFPQAVRAGDEEVEYSKYIKEKSNEIEGVMNQINSLPFDYRSILVDSLRINSELLAKIAKVHEKRFSEALVDDIKELGRKASMHDEALRIFNEKSPIILKAADDAEEITDPRLRSSIYSGLMAGTDALGKLLEITRAKGITKP